MGRCGSLKVLIIIIIIDRVLFPGGGSSLVESAYLEVAKTIFELAKQVCNTSITQCLYRINQQKLVTIYPILML